MSAGAVAAAVGIAMVPREPRSSLQFNVSGPPLPACAPPSGSIVMTVDSATTFENRGLPAAAAASKHEAPSDGVVRGKAVIDAVASNNEVLVRASVDGGDLRPLRTYE